VAENYSKNTLWTWQYIGICKAGIDARHARHSLIAASNQCQPVATRRYFSGIY
jgi:hypothetical protein